MLLHYLIYLKYLRSIITISSSDTCVNLQFLFNDTEAVNGIYLSSAIPSTIKLTRLLWPVITEIIMK